MNYNAALKDIETKKSFYNGVPDSPANISALELFDRANSTNDPNDIIAALAGAYELPNDNPFKNSLLVALRSLYTNVNKKEEEKNEEKVYDKVEIKEVKQENKNINNNPRGEYKTAIVRKANISDLSDDYYDRLAQAAEEGIFKDVDGHSPITKKESESALRRQRKIAADVERREFFNNIFGTVDTSDDIESFEDENNVSVDSIQSQDKPFEYEDVTSIYGGGFSATIDPTISPTLDQIIDQMSQGVDVLGEHKDENTQVRAMNNRGYSIILILGLLSSIITIGLIIWSYIYFL